jgi:cytochrome d ubiquinol oxidase subunit I
MNLDPLWLSRVQFGLTVAYHYLFPPLTIGLGILLVLMEGMYLRTKDRQYEAMAKFWTRIFALIFAMGVATGIVMEFEFGTNWARYSRFVGDVFGSALAAEGIFAFFLESGFLAVLVFGWERVSPRMHFFSTIMVSLGSMFSAIWIVVANSWQQTPAGYHIVHEGLLRRAELISFFGAVLNPSTLNRLAHTLIGAFILGAFFVMSVSAYYLLKRRHEEFARRSIKIALPVATVFAIVQLVSGHFNSRMVGFNQPGKLAAFEGHFRSEPGGTPLHLFGVVDEEQQRVRYSVAIPGLLSFLMYDSWSKPVTALDNPAIVPGGLPPGHTVRDYWPPVQASFQAYHLMIALGMLFIALTVFSCILWWRGSLFRQRWLLWVFVFAVVGPVIANQVGWAATEIGRQPWIVWGMLRTSDGVSAMVSGADVLTSIIVFGLIYVLLFLVWLYVMDHKIKAGPESPEDLAADAERRSFISVAAQRTGERASMTEAKPNNP